MDKAIMTMIPDEEFKSIIKSCIKEELKAFFGNEHAFKKNKEMLSMKELCQILQVSKATLIKWTRQGKVTGRRIGRRVYYKPEDVERCLKQYEVTALSSDRKAAYSYMKWQQRQIIPI
jgi:excisionase family DNA binding protein